VTETNQSNVVQGFIEPRRLTSGSTNVTRFRHAICQRRCARTKRVVSTSYIIFACCSRCIRLYGYCSLLV